MKRLKFTDIIDPIIVWSALTLAACVPSKPPVVTPPITPPVVVTCDIPTAAQQCGDIWQQELGRPIDAPALAGCLVQFARCDSGEAIRAGVHDSAEGIAHRDAIAKAIEDAKHAVQFAPLTQDGKIFRSNGQPWRWRGVTAFKLAKLFEQGGGAAIDGFLADFEGYNLLRVWDYTPAADWQDQAWDSTPAEIWLQFLQYVGHKGWRVELTLLTDDDPARIEPAKRLVDALAAAHVTNVLVEAGNEPTTHKDIATASLRSTLEHSGFPYTSGDYEDSDRFYGSYYVVHTARDSEWPRRAHDVLEAFTGAGPDKPHAPFNVPSICDEPGKWQDVGTEPDDWRAYFGACSLMGAGATFHAESVKFGQRPTDLERSLASIALSAMNAFPDDAPNGPYGRPDDASLRTYTVGPYAVRVRPTFPNPPFVARSLDPGGVLWIIR